MANIHECDHFPSVYLWDSVCFWNVDNRLLSFDVKRKNLGEWGSFYCKNKWYGKYYEYPIIT